MLVSKKCTINKVSPAFSGFEVYDMDSVPVSMVPLLLRVKDAATLLSISTSKAYAMISDKTLPSVKIGESVRVPRALLEQMVREQTQKWEAKN